jgi:phosphohistidine phosphatase
MQRRWALARNTGVRPLELILWRHAQAVHAQIGQEDSARPLTSKGHKQAKTMARWLKLHMPTDTRIICSPALRTRQTADALELPYLVLDSLSPIASVHDLLLSSNWPNSSYPILLIGHQPTLGKVASNLLSGIEQDWSMRKGGVWWISRKTNKPPRLNAKLIPELN